MQELTRQRPQYHRGGHLRIALALLWTFVAPAFLSAQEAAKPYATVGDAIPAPLTTQPGDPARGKAIVTNRQVGLCLLCHSGPFPEEKFQGDLAPTLAGAGSRWSVPELRLRIVDGSRLNADTIMPAYYKTDGLVRVGQAFAGKTILSAQQIEDVVAFLATLKDEKR
jgi:sulfur-oxidizing protein SoxX